MKYKWYKKSYHVICCYQDARTFYYVSPLEASCNVVGASLVAQLVKNPTAMWETWVRSWFGKIPWRRAWQPTPVFLPGESPWTEELGGLQSMGLRRVRHDRATKHSTALASLNPTDGSRTRLSREANMGGWRNQWMRECSSTKPLKCVPETAQLILKTL